MLLSRQVMPQIYPEPTRKFDQIKKLRNLITKIAVKINVFKIFRVSKPRRGRPKKSRVSKYFRRTKNKQLNLVFLRPIKKLLGRLNRFILNPIKQLIRSYFLSFFSCFADYPTHVFSSVLISVGIIALTNIVYIQIFRDLPNPDDLVLIDPRVTTKILDRHGEVLFRLYEDENRTLIPLSEIPLSVIQATVAIEDKDFYNHYGFSIRGISRAVLSNFTDKTDTVQGGSTLTQQLVKNRLLTPERSYVRKIKELILSIMVEERYSKQEILEMYLNQVAYGGTTYGIEEAARQYFGKSARQLSLAESALLAGLPVAPTVYSPFGSNPELSKERQKEVLRRMNEDGYISATQVESALAEQLHFRQDRVDIKAPHFVMYVKQLLAEQFGEETLYNGGLIVHTTLDLKLQNKAEESIKKEISQLEKLHINNGAGLVTNPNTGEILVMVGSTDYFDFDNDGQVNVTLRPRQPGSSIKPLTYALALENGLSTTTLINDNPVSYNIVGSPTYSPQNYDGKFHGRVTLREALASSYNVPAVKLLAHLGVNNLIDLGKKMGITTWEDTTRFGLSLTLGGGEVLMTDMATAYGVFANQGYKVDLNPILQVTDRRGKELYFNDCAADHDKCSKKLAIDPGVAYVVTHILSDNEARTPAFGPLSSLVIPDQEVAVKTGTTNNLRDNWTIGYTSDRVVSVWVGNNDNSSMSFVASGITGASPIWNNIMRQQLSSSQPHAFVKPESVAMVPLCMSTKQPACQWCLQTKDEVFLVGTQPESICRTNNRITTAPGTDQYQQPRVNTATAPGLRLID
jgi:1A family penicillin-binding protein